MVRKIGKFRLRVFILIFLLSLTTMVFYTALATNQITVIQKQQIHEEMQKSALAIQGQVDQNMQNAKRILSILARAYSEEPENIKSFNKITQEIIEDVPIITQVYIMNTDGMQIYKSSFPETMGDRSDRDYFQAAIRGEIVFSDVIVSRSTNIPIVVHAQPLMKDGEIIGVIGASIDLGFLSGLTLLSYSNPDSSYGFVVDSMGRVIGHPDQQKVAAMLDLSYLEPVAAVIRGESGNGIYEFEGVKKLVAYTPSQRTTWGILYQIPENEAFMVIERMKLFMQLSSGLVIITTLIAALVISKSLNKPIKKIVGLIGHFKSNYNPPDDFEVSSNEFGLIEGELISLTDEIRKSQQGLEDKIRDRTKDLTKAMEELVELQHKLTDANKELKELSMTDKLTGLPNRRSLEEYLRNFWPLSKRNKIKGALIMIDIDHFKAFNDTYGHVEGDNCLKAVAAELGRINRRQTDLLVRYGGEEFLIVLTNTSDDFTKNLAEKVCRGIEDMKYIHDGNKVSEFVTVSAGALFIDDLKDITTEDAITRVDNLLYEAKKQGRNRYVFEKI